VFDEVRITDANRPACPACGCGTKCTDCEDLRPNAEEIGDYGDWQIRSPFGRWEDVVRVVRPRFGQLSIFTKQSGDQPWRYWATEKVNAVQRVTYSGDPEIRLLEGHGRDSLMWLTATQSTTISPKVGGSAELAFANYIRDEHCWKVSHRRGDAENPEIIVCESKAKARSKLKELGRAYAKTMGVKFNPTGEAAR
jgi:hypothetical protein